MKSKFRVGLLLALALGLSLSPLVSSTRLCLVTLDACCDVGFDTCESKSDCCDDSERGCCFSILSEESLAKIPEGFPALVLDCVSVSYHDSFPPRYRDLTWIQSVIPDPPPLSLGDRLACMELYLI